MDEPEEVPVDELHSGEAISGMPGDSCAVDGVCCQSETRFQESFFILHPVSLYVIFQYFLIL